MKKFLYTISAVFLVPVLLTVMLSYSILHIIELFCRTINLYIDKFMRWIDKNITPYI